MSTEAKQPGLPTIDVNDYGGKKDGIRQSMNRRLFMQLIVFELPHDSARIALCHDALPDETLLL